MKWEIVYYQTATGRKVVEAFINDLDNVTKAKTFRQIDLLENYGNGLGMPHAKNLGGGLLELRVKGKREVRVFYVFIQNRRAMLLHGFIKKTQETPPKELAIARKRQKEIEE